VFVQKNLPEPFESNPHLPILNIIIFNGNEIFYISLQISDRKIDTLSVQFRNLFFNADSRVWF
jgi:hypothetical protein